MKKFLLTALASVSYTHLDVYKRQTYIRSLAHEIGQALESGAHLTSLRRTRSGGFTLEKAFEFEEFLKKLEELETK